MSNAQQQHDQTATAATTEADGLQRVIEATAAKSASIRNTAAQFLGVPADKACDLLRQVWRTSKDQPPLTDAEMFMGMSLIARYGLDPIAKEVYLTRTSKGLVCIIGIDGWIKILDRTEGYDGFEQQEKFDDKGELACVETRIYSKKRKRPTTYRGYAMEYRKVAGVVARDMPWHMLRLFSLRHAARLFTPLGGSIVTEEEARWMNAYAAAPDEQKNLAQKLHDKAAALGTAIAKRAKEIDAGNGEGDAPQQEPAGKVVETGVRDLSPASDGGATAPPPPAPLPELTPAELADLVTEVRSQLEACQLLQDTWKILESLRDLDKVNQIPAATMTYLVDMISGKQAWLQSNAAGAQPGNSESKGRKKSKELFK